MSQFSIEERGSWAFHRTTKRSEDQAYCMLGIFDVFLPFLYGSGKAIMMRELDRKIAEIEVQREGENRITPGVNYQTSYVDQVCQAYEENP